MSEASPSTIKSQPTSNEAWERFTSALADALTDLGEDEYIVISKKGSGAFVQFAGQGAYGLRAEAVSNAYLPANEQLSKRAFEDLLSLGWRAPTFAPIVGVQEPVDGAPNFFIDAAAPVPYFELARIAADSLRQVYLTRHPGELEYVAHAGKSVSIRFPSLRIKRKGTSDLAT